MHFSPAQIQQIADGGFFGPGNAQLPKDYMLMIDQIDCLSRDGGRYGKGLIKARFNIHPQHWFFACHFRGDPVMPGCLGLDALWQLLGIFLASLGLPGRGRALGVGRVKFSGQIYPDAGYIDYELHLKRVFLRPMPMGYADGYVIHQDKIIYEATDLRVGLLSSHGGVSAHRDSSGGMR